MVRQKELFFNRIEGHECLINVGGQVGSEVHLC